MVFKALTIAGSAASGAGGMPVDLRVFSQFGLYGIGSLTCTVAHDEGPAARIFALPGEEVLAQARSALKSAGLLSAVKVGMLATEENQRATSQFLTELNPDGVNTEGATPVVVDPVMFCKAGSVVDDEAAVAGRFRDLLLPYATAVTPNLVEAQTLVGVSSGTQWTQTDMVAAAHDIAAMTGGGIALVKGGLRLEGPDAVDVLVDGDREVIWSDPKVGHRPINGTGCTLAAALTANLALGQSVEDAAYGARQYLRSKLDEPIEFRDGSLALFQTRL